MVSWLETGDGAEKMVRNEWEMWEIYSNSGWQTRAGLLNVLCIGQIDRRAFGVTAPPPLLDNKTLWPLLQNISSRTQCQCLPVQSFFPLQQVRGQVVSSSAAADDQSLPKVSLGFYQELRETRILSCKELNRSPLKFLTRLLDFGMSFFMTMSTQLVRSNPLTLSSSNLHQQNPFCVSGHGSQWWGSACFCYKLDWQCPDLQTFTLHKTHWVKLDIFN